MLLSALHSLNSQLIQLFCHGMSDMTLVFFLIPDIPEPYKWLTDCGLLELPFIHALLQRRTSDGKPNCYVCTLKYKRTEDIDWHVWHQIYIYFFLWLCNPTWGMVSSFLRFIDHTQRRTAVGRTPLDEWSARRRDFLLATHNTHNRRTSMPPVGFELKYIYIYIYIYICRVFHDL